MTGAKAPARIQRLETFNHVTFVNRAPDKVSQKSRIYGILAWHLCLFSEHDHTFIT